MLNTMAIRALQGDCIEMMKTLPDKSIDLFLCDLPYGCLAGGWDVKIDLSQFWIEVKRLCRDEHTPVLMFATTRFGYELIESNPEWFRYDLVWQKTNAVGFLLANKMPMRSHEMVYVFGKKGARYYRKDVEGDFPAGGGGRSKSSYMPALNELPNLSSKVEAGRRCVTSVVTIPNKKIKGGHPTQKPADLYAWLIERYSKEGDVVLDPTAGSFTSVATAARMGRTGIGIELNEAFVKKYADKSDEESRT